LQPKLSLTKMNYSGFDKFNYLLGFFKRDVATCEANNKIDD